MASSNVHQMDKQLSRFLSRHLDFDPAVGTEETVKVRRFVKKFNENLRHLTGIKLINTGSKSEGLEFGSSDVDTMVLVNDVIVVQPRDRMSERGTSKTIFTMEHTDCSSGYTLLRLQHVGTPPIAAVMDAMVELRRSGYLSSFKFLCNILERGGGYIHGPCATQEAEGTEMDFAPCFHCPSWPHDLSDFSTRTRYCVWPSRALVNRIVKQGCHVVPIGEKQSDMFPMQWRISFALAEITLVTSFNHVQLKTYALLKILLKQCIERELPVDDLLCSYFMKTIVFHAIEHSNPSMWVDENIIRCFWYCFTILLECVQTGYMPNYFVPSHNMLLSKVTGENRKTVLRVLSRYTSMGYNCLFQCPSLQSLLQIIQESGSLYPPPGEVKAHEIRQDICVWTNARVAASIPIDISQAIKLTANVFLDHSGYLADVGILYFIHGMTGISCNLIADLTKSRFSNNKTTYRRILKHKRLLHLSTEKDACHGLLSLATSYYNVGCYSKVVEEATRVISTCQQRVLLQDYGDIDANAYMEGICGKGYTLLYKAKRVFVFPYAIHKTIQKLYPPELETEVQNSQDMIHLPPIPYALVLIVLSTYMLGDIIQSRTVLEDLLIVISDPIYGTGETPILDNLVRIYHICLELLRNTGQTIQTFDESCRRKLPDNQATAISIATISQVKGGHDENFNTLDYRNILPRHHIDGNTDDDVDYDNNCHKTMYVIDPVMSWF